MSKFDIAADGVPAAHGRRYCSVNKLMDKGAGSNTYFSNNSVDWVVVYTNFEMRADEIQKLQEIEGMNSVHKAGRYQFSLHISPMHNDVQLLGAFAREMQKIMDHHDRPHGPGIRQRTPEEEIEYQRAQSQRPFGGSQAFDYSTGLSGYL